VEETGARVEIGELPAVAADPLQMRQLFQNLIGNALKFSRPGVPPHVRVSASLPGDGTAVIRVADNGIGFDVKYLDRIFVPFERLHGRMEYEGTGMGLAICRKIAERHKGAITAESEPGEGTTFVVTLPLRHAEDESR
jgi:signal transduction histidine kinase